MESNPFASFSFKGIIHLIDRNRRAKKKKQEQQQILKNEAMI